MNQQHFEHCMKDIFSAFGRKEPTGNAIMSIWKRVRNFPDSFMTWAAEKLSYYEKLPGNLSLEIEKNLYPQWRSETGQPLQERACCHECDTKFPGFFMGYRWHEGGRAYNATIRCLCNDDPAFDPMQRKSRDQAEREGWSLVPIGMSHAKFERENFYQGGDSAGGIGALAMRLSRNPAPQEPIRKAHAAQLEFYDAVPF